MGFVGAVGIWEWSYWLGWILFPLVSFFFEGEGEGKRDGLPDSGRVSLRCDLVGFGIFADKARRCLRQYQRG